MYLFCIYCVTEKNLTQFGLNKNWRILSSNKDEKNNLTFISSLESIRYPFVGLQFHPEKNIFEWRKDRNYPHSPNAISVSRYFYDWLVTQAKQNDNSFKSEEEMYKSLIDNFNSISTSGKLIYDNIYLFELANDGNQFKLSSLCSLSYIIFIVLVHF